MEVTGLVNTTGVATTIAVAKAVALLRTAEMENSDFRITCLPIFFVFSY